MISNVKLRIPVSDSDHSLGSNDASVTLVEYGDYECPFCAQSDQIVRHLRRDLGRDLRYVFRNFPLTEVHPHAADAARAAEAAGLQERFWKMHDLLFKNQDRLDRKGLLEHAASLGLDLDRFSIGLENPEIEKRIAQDQHGGMRSGVSGTPTFFVNGYRYDGDWSYEPMLGALESIRDLVSRGQIKKAI